LVEQKNPQLWAKVLHADNTYRSKVVDQVVHSVLPETKDASQVKATVKAFMDADLQGELLELLEKLVLHTSEFSQNPKLQNLLVLTAIRVRHSIPPHTHNTLFFVSLIVFLYLQFYLFYLYNTN
jgi:clathrin heavy chain